MVSKAAREIGTELAMKYSFRNRRQSHSQIHTEEGVDNQGKPSPENEHSNVKKGTTRSKAYRRPHVSVAFEDRVEDGPVQKEGTHYSSSGAREIENKKSKWEPKNWHEVVNNIREMRKQRDAPVDTMGCDKCTDESAPPEVNVDYCCCSVYCVKLRTLMRRHLFLLICCLCFHTLIFL
jgi:hypothetical protein